MLNKFFYNGHWSDEFGIRVETPPTMVKPARKFQSASVMGRNGNIYQMQNAYDEVIVSYKINAGTSTRGVNQSIFTSIIEWLNSADDYAILKDTYDTTHYRKAVYVDSVNIDNLRTMYGKATINFRCRPERFLLDQTEQVESGDTITNETNHDASPLITLTGGGARSLLQLEGHTLSGEQYEWMTSALNNQVAVRDTKVWMSDAQNINGFMGLAGSIDGTLNTLDDANGILEYTPASGKWFYGIGFIKAVSPNTDYTISCEFKKITTSLAWAFINVMFLSGGGLNNTLEGIRARISVNESWTPATISFTTPSECGYIFITFTNSTNATTKREIRNIMVNSGSTAKTFRGFALPSENTVQINDTILKITSAGFDTAEIDCDKENVTIDGANGNPLTQVTDQYGNLSAKYLQLQTGENTITFSGDIASVTVDPMTWKL